MSRIGVRDAVVKASRMVLKAPKPTEILWMNFAVTYLCNGRCRVCRIWERYRRDASGVEGELTLAEVENLLSSNYLQNLQGISLTGGEPFLRRDLVDLAGLFIQRFPDAILGIATNGLSPQLILKKTKRIVQRYHPKLLSLSISLDGIGAAHNRMRGVKGAYHKVLETVESVVQETDVNVGLDFTVTPWNYEQVWSAYQLSKQYGIKFIAVFAHNSDFYYDNAGIDLDLGHAQEDGERMVRAVAADRAENESLFDKLVDPYACFMTKAAENHAMNAAEYRCWSGTHSMFLDPHGDVYPCIILNRKLGSIRQASLDNIWLSSRAMEVRNYAEQQRCQCWVACETVPSLLRGLTVPKWNLTNKILAPILRRAADRS